MGTTNATLYLNYTTDFYRYIQTVERHDIKQIITKLQFAVFFFLRVGIKRQTPKFNSDFAS